MYLDPTELLRTCTDAHRNTSHSPEKLWEMYATQYKAELQADLERIEWIENKQKYAQRYNRYFLDRMNAKSNCISSMITWPARFPVARARKNNEREQAKRKALESFREKRKNGPPKPRATAEQQAESLPMKLGQMEALRDRMKAENKEAKKQGKEKPHASYSLTNLGARIRKTKKDIEEMNARIEAHKHRKDIEFEGWTVTVWNDRLKILFYNKPNEETRQLMKSRWFKRSPKNEARQRQFTSNAVRSLSYVMQHIVQS